MTPLEGNRNFFLDGLEGPNEVKFQLKFHKPSSNYMASAKLCPKLAYFATVASLGEKTTSESKDSSVYPRLQAPSRLEGLLSSTPVTRNGGIYRCLQLYDSLRGTP